MKSLKLFVQCILRDLGMRCRTSTSQDLKTVLTRIEHEGLEFLTITLANLGTEFQKALDQGFVASQQFSSVKKSGRLPLFLGGFFELVFDRQSGRLLDEPSVDAIQAIRQFLLMWAKIEIPCSDRRRDAAFDQFVKCEQEVRKYDRSLDPDLLGRFKRLSTLLWARSLSQVDQQVYYGEIVPGHGPGATADKLRGNAKWTQQEWTTRLERVFPHMEYLATSWSLALANLHAITLLEPGAERPVRVVDVPKTHKSPRLIAIEPTCMQYVQQGLLQRIEEAVEADYLARCFISTRSQEPNRELAREGSRDGTLATLDLKEASDRVSYQHVLALLANTPHLREAVDACRSRKADVPGHGVIRLAKFASMGSALCFPFEAMVFCTVVMLGIEQSLRRQLSLKDLEGLRGRVRVYGDDIIVPVEHVRDVVSCLEAFGFKVGSDKSFWTGKFRESCGGDYYDGHDITVVRLRSPFPTQRTHVSELVSTVKTRNLLYERGFWSAAAFLDEVIESVIDYYPIVEETSPVLGRRSFLGYIPEKFDEKLHAPLVRGYVVSSKSPESPLDDYGALLKCLTTRSDLPITDVEHLERAGRPSAVNTKLRWASPF